MIGIIVSGHGIFSQGMLSAAELIVGRQENVKNIDFTISTSTDELKEEMKKKVNSFSDCDDILILCDLVGGTPFKTAALIATEKTNLKVIGGANLGMFIEAIFGRLICKDVSELTELCLNSINQSVQKFIPNEEVVDTEGDEL